MDKLGQSGLAEELLVYYGLVPKDIAKAVKKVLEKK